MIITIKGADFSGSNIGTLDTYLVSKSIGAGATHDIPNYVTKNAAVSWTITLSEGYTFGTYSITMGGATVTPTISPDGKTMTVAISAVTGKVVISVATVNESTGEEDEGGDTLTWYIDHATQIINNVSDLTGSGLGITVGAFAYPDDIGETLVGKPINIIQCFVHTAGTFTFYKWNKASDTLTSIQSFDLQNPSTELQTYQFDTEFTLAAGEYIALGNTSDTGKTRYYYAVDFGNAYNAKHYYKVGHGATILPSLVNLGINIGYKK